MVSAWIAILLVIGVVLLVIKAVNKKQALAVKVVIVLFIFVALSAGYVYITYDVDITSLDGLLKGGKLYFSWLGSLFRTGTKVTAYAVHQDWDAALTNATAQ